MSATVDDLARRWGDSRLRKIEKQMFNGTGQGSVFDETLTGTTSISNGSASTEEGSSMIEKLHDLAEVLRETSAESAWTEWLEEATGLGPEELDHIVIDPEVVPQCARTNNPDWVVLDVHDYLAEDTDMVVIKPAPGQLSEVAHLNLDVSVMAGGADT